METEPWSPELGPLIDPMENVEIYRAMSILSWLRTRDGERVGPLPIEQARDVIAWFQSSQSSRWL